jgi:hypothetical protein
MGFFVFFILLYPKVVLDDALDLKKIPTRKENKVILKQ